MSWIDVTIARSRSIALTAVFVAVTGCGGTEDRTGAIQTTSESTVKVNTPAQIAQESADNYDDNVNGLITGATLKRWIDDWANNRPSSISGKLVVLQLSEGETGYEVIAPNNENVFTYLVSSSELTETRHNGVIETISMVPSGPKMDSFLARYGIDPARDMIVCAQGKAGASQAMWAGRCWYMFRYWGTAKEHLALLDGGNQWQVDGGDMTAEYFTSKAGASTPPNNGTASVKDLAEDNTALLATLEDMMNVVPDTDMNIRSDGVFIWDARSIDQYSAGEVDESGNAPANFTCPAGDYSCTFQNRGSRQGHPKGALQLNFTNLLVASEGYRYKSKSELSDYLAGVVDGSGKGFVDATYQPVGPGNAYQAGDTIYTYCETTFRAMITGIAAGVILGKPTRFYDGAMYQWNSLTGQSAGGNNLQILPEHSPWRTDVKSFYRLAPPTLTVAQRAIINASAESADAIVVADKTYKGTFGAAPDANLPSDGGSDSGSGGGGGILPPNPCGG